MISFYMKYLPPFAFLSLLLSPPIPYSTILTPRPEIGELVIVLRRKIYSWLEIQLLETVV